MQNLHLKNLQNSTTLDYLITELKKINIIDPKINDFRNSYLTNIKQYKQFKKIPSNELLNIKNNIIKFKKIKNLGIGSTIDMNKYNCDKDYHDDLKKCVCNVTLIEYLPIDYMKNDSFFIQLNAIVIGDIVTNIVTYY